MRAIVAGEIGTVGGAYVLAARVIAAVTAEGLVAERETAASTQELIAAVDRLSAKVRERIGESLRTVRSTPPLNRVTTNSLEALRLYSQGCRMIGTQTQTDAIPFFKQAIALDTGFATAYAALAVIYRNTGRDPVARIEATRKAYTLRDRLTEPERYMILARYYGDVEADREQEMATYRRMLERYPDAHAALNNLGMGLRRQRRWEEAEELFRRARAIWRARFPERHHPSYTNILHSQFALNRTAALDSSLRLFEGVRPDLALFYASRLAAARRDYDSAWQGFQQYVEQYPSFGGRFRFAQVAAVRGQLTRAAQEWWRIMALADEQDDALPLLLAATDLAQVTARYRGAHTEAARSLDAALERYPLDSFAPEQRPYPELVAAYAAVGQDTEASNLLAAYRREIPEEARRLQPNRHRAVGWMALATGEFDQAIAAFRAFDESGCGSCGVYELAHTFDMAGNVDSAVVIYERAVAARVLNLRWHFRWLPVAYRRLGELYEQRGDREKAIDYYNRFVDLWQDADPELQPQVEDVKQRLARLVGEPP